MLSVFVARDDMEAVEGGRIVVQVLKELGADVRQVIRLWMRHRLFSLLLFRLQARLSLLLQT